VTAIDVHAHAVPPGLEAALDRDQGACGVEIRHEDDGPQLYVGGRPAGPLRKPMVDLEARLSAMDAAGVDMQLVATWIGITGYQLPPEQGRLWARLFNDSLAEMVADHPDRFLGLCTVPMQDPQAAAEELRRAIGAGFVGAEIATRVDGRDLDDPALEPFWAAAEELQCLVLVHPDLTLPGRAGAPYFLNNLVGNGAETTIAVSHLLFSGALERHPDLRLILVHGGAHLPYQAGRLDHGFEAASKLTAKHITQRPSDQLKRLYFDTVTHSHDVLRFLIDFAGADHVVLGSDYPFEMGQPDPVTFVQSLAGLSEQDQEKILSGNVRGLIDSIHKPEQT
jgi:aminocarboxymuconate-semialdehyde decarboxylase